MRNHFSCAFSYVGRDHVESEKRVKVYDILSVRCVRLFLGAFGVLTREKV